MGERGADSLKKKGGGGEGGSESLNPKEKGVRYYFTDLKEITRSSRLFVFFLVFMFI